MTAKNLFLLGSMVFLLSACGGSDETAQQDSEQLPVEQVTPTPSATPINLTGITGNSVVTKTQVSGAVASSRGVVGTTVANSQATITLSQINLEAPYEVIGFAALHVDPKIIFFIFNLVILEVLNMFNIETASGFTSAKSALLSAAK